MEKRERILTIMSLLFMASFVFVILNALNTKLGLAGGCSGCPSCLCDCNTVAGNEWTVGICGENTICDGTGNCRDCAFLGCGTHFGACKNVLDCGACLPTCPDGFCDVASGECSTCVADCTVADCCGTDSACNAGVGEDCSNCAGDCGACAPVCVPACVDSGWNGCASSCVKSKSNNGVCTAGSCGTATANVGSGKYCSGGSEVAGKCSDDNHCSGNTYYDGYTCNGSGSCDIINYGDIGCCNHTKCGADQYCNSSHSCTNLSACHERSGGSYGQNSVTAAEGRGCTGATSYCCSGTCVNPTPSEYGSACGSGDCTIGNTAVWTCDGTDYKCSSKDTGCGYCLPGDDYRYEYICDKEGICSLGTEPNCPECQTCQDDGDTTSCVASYEAAHDTVDPNLCDNSWQVCHGGICKLLATCGDGIFQNPNETGIGGPSGTGDEECDGMDDATCGGLGCLDNCICNKCGNGVIDPGETCDTNGDIGCDSSSSASTCSSNCNVCTCLLADSKLNNLIFSGNFLGKRTPILCILRSLILYILKIVGSIFLLSLIIGGIYYMISGSNPDKQKKAKKIVTYAILGIALVLVSYIILALIEQILVQL